MTNTVAGLAAALLRCWNLCGRCPHLTSQVSASGSPSGHPLARRGCWFRGRRKTYDLSVNRIPAKCVNDFLRRRVRVNFRQTRTVSSEYRRRHQDHDGTLPLPHTTNVGALCNGATGWPHWAKGVAPDPQGRCSPGRAGTADTGRSSTPHKPAAGSHRSIPSTKSKRPGG